jgi:hypothetical protein
LLEEEITLLDEEILIVFFGLWGLGILGWLHCYCSHDTTSAAAKQFHITPVRPMIGIMVSQEILVGPALVPSHGRF